MKIAFLNIYSGLVNRGAETFVHELATRLRNQHRVVVFQGGKSSPQKYQTIVIPNIKLISTETHPDLFNKLKYRFYLDTYNQQVLQFTKQCLNNLKKEDYDIIISINGYLQLNVLMSQLNTFKAKVIFVNQAQFHPSILHMAGWDNWWKLKQKPDAFVCVTDIMYQWVNQHTSPQTKVIKIPNGVDLIKFNPFVKPVKINLPVPIILCVAGLQKYKRIGLLIEAVASLNSFYKSKTLTDRLSKISRNSLASLLVLGDGPLKPELTTLGRQLLGDQRFKIISVPYDHISNYYSACDLFSLPSEPLEAFGIAYLEAMACNKPVIAPDDDSRKEIIGDGGMLTQVTDINKYAQALSASLNFNWGNKPRKQAEKFSWDIVAKQYENLFTRLLTSMS